MTDAERRLWPRLRLKQLRNCQFYRQKIIGEYIVDFFCPKARLIVEVDGSQHLTPEGREADGTRDRFMAKLGYKMLRLSDTEVLKNTEGVVEVIFQAIETDG